MKLKSTNNGQNKSSINKSSSNVLTKYMNNKTSSSPKSKPSKELSMKAFTNFTSEKSLYYNKSLFNPMFTTDDKNKAIDKYLNTSYTKITKAWNEGNNQIRDKSNNRIKKSNNKLNNSID